MRRFKPKTARLWRFTALPPWLLVAAAMLGCASPTVVQTPREKAVGLYHDGLEHMRSGAFLEAQQVFQELVAMPAYLSVTSLARLRLADTLFQQRKYVEAFEIYMTYARRHDGSKNVPYARFMAARSRFEMVPTDFWLLPPVEEMDLSAADRARVLLERFVRRYPTSRHVTVAHQHVVSNPHVLGNGFIVHRDRIRLGRTVARHEEQRAALLGLRRALDPGSNLGTA